MQSLTREAILNLMERHLAERDETIFVPAINEMITSDDRGTFAIMQGSGKEMSPFDQFLHLSKRRGFLTDQEGIAYIQKFYATLREGA